MENAPGASGACSFTFLYKIRMKQMDNAPNASEPIPPGFLIKSLLKINGQRSWSSLGQVLYISSSHPY